MPKLSRRTCNRFASVIPLGLKRRPCDLRQSRSKSRPFLSLILVCHTWTASSCYKRSAILDRKWHPSLRISVSGAPYVPFRRSDGIRIFIMNQTLYKKNGSLPARKSTGRATLNTGILPDVFPLISPLWACPWNTTEAPKWSIVASRWLEPKKG